MLVDSFYSKAREDELSVAIFDDTISDWEHHLPTMYQFWERLLLGSPDYNGNPFIKHMDLSLDEFHFARWLEIFNQTLDENFLAGALVLVASFAIGLLVYDVYLLFAGHNEVEEGILTIPGSLLILQAAIAEHSNLNGGSGNQIKGSARASSISGENGNQAKGIASSINGGGYLIWPKEIFPVSMKE